MSPVSDLHVPASLHQATAIEEADISYLSAREPQPSSASLPTLVFVVEGNPLEDISVVQRQDDLRLIMKGGRVVKDTLESETG